MIDHANLCRVSVTNQIQEFKIKLAQDVAEKEVNEVRKMIMEVVRVDGNAVEIEAVIETSAVHPMKETEIETSKEIRIEIDMRAVVVVLLINNVKSRLLAPGEIVPEIALETVQSNGHETTSPDGDAINRPVKIPYLKAIAQTIQETIDVPIIKSLRKNTRKNHPKNMTAPMMIAVTRRKQRRANVRDLDREDGDEIKMPVN